MCLTEKTKTEYHKTRCRPAFPYIFRSPWLSPRRTSRIYHGQSLTAADCSCTLHTLSGAAVFLAPRCLYSLLRGLGNILLCRQQLWYPPQLRLQAFRVSFPENTPKMATVFPKVLIYVYPKTRKAVLWIFP